MATKKTNKKDAMATKLSAAENALLTGKAKEYSLAKAALDKEVEEFNTNARHAKYAEFAKTDSPFIAFANAVKYDGKRVKETRNKDTKVVESISVIDTDRRLNLKEFVEYCKIDTTMLKEIAELLTVLTVREQNICKLKHEDYDKQSPFFCRVVKAKEAGETPDSNTQICKRIQNIMDGAGIDCRVINPDMHFIQQCSFVHDSKGIARVKPVPAGKFMTIIVDMMAHFVQGIPYSVFIKEQKKDA